MLNIEYRLKLGQDEFIIRGDYKNAKEFFNSMSFFSSLPKTAPGGATDLKLVVRETKKGTYYSLVSEQEKMEFTLGQHKEGDTLYAKEWKPLYGAGSESGEEQGQQQQYAAPIMVGQPQQQVQYQPSQQQVVQPQMIQPQAIQPQQPVQQQQQFVAPTQMVMPQPVQQPVQQQQQQVVQPVQQPVQPAAPVGNPQVAAVASNVLSRFGIKN